MAENDIELSVGIKIDEAQFLNSYNSFINKTASETQKQVQSALDDTKGAAAKQWGPLPYVSMHNTASGASAATKAFLPSFASDIAASGYSPDSLGYQSALINAAYRSSMADPMQRYHRMLAMGLMQQADLTHPDTPLGRAIETDYALMSQPWSRDFIRAGQQEVLSADELGKMNLKALRAKASTMGLKGLSGKKKADVISAMVAKSQEPTLSFDFASMRDYAVGTGLGRWIDEDGGNTADNFEFINDELDKIEDKSKKTKKAFLDWGDALKGALGTLTAIAAIGIKAFEVAYKSSEAHTIQAGGALDKRRAFIGMSALDELKTKVASKSVGLGEDAIKNEIYSMSGNIEQYKLMGQGDALPSALLNIFGNLMSAEDPYDVYTKSADQIYNQLKGADDATRRRWLMLMNKAGLGSMSSLVGQFLSNPEYAKQYKTPSALFNLKSNPYYGVYGEAETMLPNLTQLNASIKASYDKMYKDWEKSFGEPFKTWWDETLKDKVVPWFERMLEIAGIVKDSSTGDAKATSDFDKAWDKTLKKQQKANSVSNREKISGYWSIGSEKAIRLNDKVSWESYAPDTSLFVPAAKTKVTNINDANPKTFLSALELMTKDTAYAPGTRHDAVQSRAEVAWNFLKTTGLYNDLNDLRTTDIDKYTMRVIKEYLAEGDRNILDTYLSEAYTKSEGWKELLEFIREYKTYLKQHPEQLTEKVELLFNGYGGEKLLEEARKELNR